jgi:hypothetical protein
MERLPENNMTFDPDSYYKGTPEELKALEEAQESLAAMLESENNSDSTNRLVWYAVISFFMIAIPLCGGDPDPDGPPSEFDKKMEGSAIVQSFCNYPDSYKYQSAEVSGNQVTVRFKAKNAFGMEKLETMTVTVSD